MGNCAKPEKPSKQPDRIGSNIASSVLQPQNKTDQRSYTIENLAESGIQPQNATPQEAIKLQVKEVSSSMEHIISEIVAQNDDLKVQVGLNLLLRLVSNIIEKPTEQKYRTIKNTNAKLQKDLFSLKGGVSALIQEMGFQFQGDNEHYVFVGDNFMLIMKGKKLLEDALESVNYKLMTPEEQKKQDILRENKRIYQEEQAKKKAFIAEQKRLQEYDQKEKATQEIKTIHANKNLKPFAAERGEFKAPAKEEPRGG